MNTDARRIRVVTTFTAALGIWAWTMPSDSRAVSGCTVSVTSTDGTIKILRDWHQQRAPVGRGERRRDDRFRERRNVYQRGHRHQLSTR